MAMIHEEVLIIKVSKLVKSNEQADEIATQEVLSALEQVAQELVGSNVIIEVEKA